MPRPMAANTASACAAGKPTAKPSEAPMKGAVQGEAMAVASTPDKKSLTVGLWACRPAKRLGSSWPNSNKPARFRPSNVNSKARPATTAGLCN